MSSKNIQAKEMLLEIKDFSGGLNTREDPRVINPNESPLIQNMDISAEGAIITRTGFRSLITVGSGGYLLGSTRFFKSGESGFDRVIMAHSDGNLYYYDNSTDVTQQYVTNSGDNYVMNTGEQYVTNNVNSTLIGSYRVVKGTGTITVTAASGAVVGAGTGFTSAFKVGSKIVANGETHTVTVITDDLHMTTDVWTGSGSVLTYTTDNGLDPSGKWDWSILNNILVYTNGTSFPQYYDGTQIKQLDKFVTNHINPKYLETWLIKGSQSGSGMYATGDSNISSTVYYSDVGDPQTWVGGLSGSLPVYQGDGDENTGMKVLNQSMYVFKRYSSYILGETLDSNTNDILISLSANRLPVGCVANDSIVQVYNDLYRLVDTEIYGVCTLGAQQGYLTFEPRNNSLSWVIRPTIQNINPETAYLASGSFYNDKYFLSVPVSSSTQNNTTLVNSHTRDGRTYWVEYPGISASQFIIYPDAKKKNQLLFTSGFSNKLYAFDDSIYSDDLNGYTRKYVTKIFDFGDRVASKEFKQFWIRGEINVATSFKMTIRVDNQVFSWDIDKRYLEFAPAGETMGSNIYGESILGGTGSVGLARFMFRDDFPNSISNGRELQITFENQNAGQPFKIDYIGIDYVMHDRDYNYPQNLSPS